MRLRFQFEEEIIENLKIGPTCPGLPYACLKTRMAYFCTLLWEKKEKELSISGPSRWLVCKSPSGFLILASINSLRRSQYYKTMVIKND